VSIRTRLRHDYHIAHREYFRARDRERRRDIAEFVDSQKLGKQCAGKAMLRS
jgi:hypothetical protein